MRKLRETVDTKRANDGGQSGRSSDCHRCIIQQWEVPGNFDCCEKRRDEESLPKHWPNPEKKIFHLVRQLYWQMVSGKRRYGIMHTYERWFFCKRTEAGTL
jgi:hypothetical protein